MRILTKTPALAPIFNEKLMKNSIVEIQGSGATDESVIDIALVGDN